MAENNIIAWNPINGVYPEFIGSSTILNNGKTPNNLVIGITNNNPSGKEYDILVNSGFRFYIWFVVTGDQATTKEKEREWALTTKTQLYDDAVKLSMISHNGEDETTKWETPVQHQPSGSTLYDSLAGWELVPKKDFSFTLQPQDTMRVHLSGLITNLPDGPTVAYLGMQSSYTSNRIKVSILGTVHKTPHVVRGNKVGIGLNNPNASLDVNGGIRASGGIPNSANSNNIGFFFNSQNDTVTGMSSAKNGQMEFYLNSREAVQLKTVPIPPSVEQFRLNVSGGIRAESGTPGSFGDNNSGFFFKTGGKDNNSGMSSSADNRLEFYTKSIEILKLHDSNVGINLPNENPQTFLHIGNRGKTNQTLLKIDGKNGIELGGGEQKNNHDNGKIAYQIFSSGLDIVGAGTTSQNRQINLWGNIKANNEPPFIFKNVSVMNGKTVDTKINATSYVAMVVGFSNESYDINEGCEAHFRLRPIVTGNNWYIDVDLFNQSGNAKKWIINVLGIHRNLVDDQT